MSTRACRTPSSFADLADYWTDDLDAERSRRVEDHLFDCAACADRAGRVVALTHALREVIPPVVSPERLARLREGGVRVRTTEVQPGRPVTVAFSPDVDLLVHRLKADLGRAFWIDCAVLDADGTPIFDLEHVPFDREAGEVLIACQRHYVAQYAADVRFRVAAVDADGTITTREYRVLHDAERP